MKRQIFKIVFLSFLLVFTNSFSADILEEYEGIKDTISSETVTPSKNFFFVSSFSKVTSNENIDIELNKQLAYSKLIEYLKKLVDWPKKINAELKYALWNFHMNQKSFNFKKSQLVDNGKLGDLYYVIIGIPKDELLRHKINYNQIINNLKE